MGRTIDENLVIDIVTYECGEWSGLAKEIVKQIKAIPSAERKGHWIYGEDEYGIDGYHCDECGFFVPWDYAHKFINFIEDYHYCPSCGARMESEE